MKKTNLTIQDLIKKVEANNGIVFRNPFYLNLIGIRDLDRVNSFNDELIAYYFDESGEVHYTEIEPFTTDAGLKSLKKPVNAKGCAILCEGWHRKLWKKGLHKGQYDAFVQASPCKVYRDNNKDSKIDTNPATIDEGMFGINLHRANANVESVQVDGWSAGCQVVANPKDFKELLKLRDQAIAHGQDLFSYYLFKKEEV